MIYKSVELSPSIAEQFKIFLKKNKIKYEASSCYNLIHFEVLVDDELTSRCNDWLEKN